MKTSPHPCVDLFSRQLKKPLWGPVILLMLLAPTINDALEFINSLGILDISPAMEEILLPSLPYLLALCAVYVGVAHSIGVHLKCYEIAVKAWRRSPWLRVFSILSLMLGILLSVDVDFIRNLRSIRLQQHCGEQENHIKLKLAGLAAALIIATTASNLLYKKAAAEIDERIKQQTLNNKIEAETQAKRRSRDEKIQQQITDLNLRVQLLAGSFAAHKEVQHEASTSITSTFATGGFEQSQEARQP